MWFNSFGFWLFFGLVVLVYRQLALAGQNRWLLLASYFFYGCFDVRFLGLIVFCTAFNYHAALRIDAASDASAPFGMRMAHAGVCSAESGGERRRIRIGQAPILAPMGISGAANQRQRRSTDWIAGTSRHGSRSSRNTRSRSSMSALPGFISLASCASTIASSSLPSVRSRRARP